MLRETDLLVSTQQWIAQSNSRRSGSAVISEIEASPQDRYPQSISWILEGPDFVGQVVIWSDGQAEVDLVNVATGEARAEHKQINDRDGLVSILAAVNNWVVRDESR